MPSSFSDNKRIAKNTVFLYIRMAVVLLISLYTTRVILKVLGVEDYGVYNVVAGFVSMFAFLNASFVATIQRYYNFELGKKGMEGVYSVYSNAIIIQSIIAILVLILTETIGLWYLNNKLVIPPDRLPAARLLFHCSIISLSLVILQVPFSSVIMALEKMNYYAIVGVVDAVLKLVIVIILRHVTGDRLEAYALLLLAVSVVVFLMNFIYVKLFLLKGRIKICLNKILIKSMVAFSAWSILGAGAQIIRNQGLNVVLNLFFGPVVNAARGISYQVKGALSGFIANISVSVRPQLVSSYAAGDTDRAFNLMYSISKINFLLLYMLALPVCVEMGFVLHLWLGDSFPEYTIIFSRLILVIALVDVFNGPVSMIMYASGKIGLYNVITSLLGLMVLPLSYCILQAGNPPYSVYLMSLVISVVVQTASLIIMKYKVGASIKSYLRIVVFPSLLVMLCSLPFPLILFFLMNESLLRVILIVIVSVTFVGFGGYFIGLNNNEKRLLHSLVGRFVVKQKH